MERSRGKLHGGQGLRVQETSVALGSVQLRMHCAKQCPRAPEIQGTTRRLQEIRGLENDQNSCQLPIHQPEYHPG